MKNTEQFFKLSPAIKDYVWGGQNLLYKANGGYSRVAETWELSTHKDGQSIIASGANAGKSFGDFVANNPNVLGGNCARFKYFPVLIKLIDAAQNLSVQVHPNDEYALKHEGEYGKTEMWYIIDCLPNSGIYCGFKKAITKQQLLGSITDGSILDKLNFYKVKKGDFFFINAGTIHAIGAGVTICEIQQNSNTTYRVFDYNRLVDGKPRVLHVDKAVDVTTLEEMAKDGLKNDNKVLPCGTEVKTLANCEYFNTYLLNIKSKYLLPKNALSFTSFVCTGGSGIIEDNAQKMPIQKGDSFFVYSNAENINLSGNLSVIKTEI